jgi:hypothetical protein
LRRRQETEYRRQWLEGTAIREHRAEGKEQGVRRRKKEEEPKNDHEGTKGRKHEEKWGSIKDRILFVFSSFRAFVIKFLGFHSVF